MPQLFEQFTVNRHKPRQDVLQYIWPQV